MDKIEYVPTNIITGALGVGKTTLIQSLLEHKPANERWAVLVNEFGEIGVDGALLSDPENKDVFIKEVPGGCMCCTSGLPMQIALNLLLAKARPHRLLIEPTGLGHPKEVLETLTAEHYQDVLNVGATLTLIDVRKLADKRWRAHHTFQEQLQIADHVVATKFDLYGEILMPKLHQYLKELDITDIPVTTAENGQIDTSILLAPSKYIQATEEHNHSHSHASHSVTQLTTNQIIRAPETGSIKVANNGQGYYSYGWICAPTEIFNHRCVMDTLTSLPVERLKAVLITEQGVVSCNLSDGCLSINMIGLEEAVDSRLEFLSQDKTLADETCQTIENAFGLASE